MSLFDRVSLFAGAALVALILVGMVRHRLAGLCRSFLAYLVAMASGSLLIALWPGTFYNWSFWQAKDLTYGVLTFLVALEVAALSFQVFPGAQLRARQLSFAVLAVTLAAIILTPRTEQPGVSSQAAFYLEVQPRLANGTVFLFAAVWAVVLWYIIPLHRWHRAILRGLLPYLLIFTGAVRLLASWGWHARAWIGYSDTAFYLAVLVYWVWEAWRHPPPEDESDILRRLQPWRDQR